ncbi:MAG: formylglycine-generating enzyme family protein [Thermoguttaceae bacterium]
MTVVMNDDFNKPGVAPGDHRSMVVNGVEYRFCWCPPGTFMMGSAEDEKDHENFETLHEVTLTRGFWLLETEVTQLLWRSVTGRTVKDELRLYQPNVGGVFEPDEIKRVDRLGYGSSYPIYFISWNEATDFCRILSEKTGLNIQLPTEAQWEYACRAGTLGPFAVTQVSEVTLNAEGVTTTRLSMTDPADMCWYNENSNAGVQEVKQRVPNAWGLYDMHGNVWEMCADRYSKDYYSRSPATDPTGSTSGEYRVNRGGSWFSYLKFCRSACRYRNAEDYRYNNLGFRIAINPR